MTEYVMVSGWFCIGSISAIIVACILSGGLLAVLDSRISRHDSH